MEVESEIYRETNFESKNLANGCKLTISFQNIFSLTATLQFIIYLNNIVYGDAL